MTARRVVVKRIRGFDSPEQARQAVRQLRSEQIWQARINSPFVAPVLDIGTHSEFGPFIVTPYYPSTLSRTLATSGFLPTLGYGLRIIDQVLQGLADSYRDAGVIHLDIKPANIGLDHRGDVRLLDFGLAKLVGANQNTTTGLAFTTWYAPPEQIFGTPKNWPSSACDVRATFATLYEILTGKPPFYREALAMGLLDGRANSPLPYDVRFRRLITEQTPTPPSGLVPGLPREIDELVMSGLEQDARRRIPGPHRPEVRNALEALRKSRRAARRYEDLPVGREQASGQVLPADERVAANTEGKKPAVPADPSASTHSEIAPEEDTGR